jgi:triosephosphate isomerase
MRQQIAAANWKMNCTLQQAEELLNKLATVSDFNSVNRIVIVAVPAPYLLLAKQKLAHQTNMFVAAQNCFTKKSGAYTGEISAEMLQSMDINYVLIGHSERREYFNENNTMLAEKVNLALEYEVTPIFCCGESLSIREAGNQNEFVAQQLKDSLFQLSAAQIVKVVIAYEPIWAIGTGKTASSAQAQEMHQHIRKALEIQYGSNIADAVSVLYGGSVKGNNAVEIFSQPDVDGGLVGGASLVAEEFVAIMNALK